MSELLCRPAQVLEWHGSLTVLPKPSHCHVSNPICVSTVMWVRKERLPPGHLNYAPGDPRSLPVSSYCTGGWGGWPLSFPSELDPSVPYCPLLPTAWSEGGEAFWQGWLTELSSQGTCQPPGLPDGVLRAALACGSCSGPWVQPRRRFTRCSTMSDVRFCCCHSYHGDGLSPRQGHAATDLETRAAAAESSSLWGVIS